MTHPPRCRRPTVLLMLAALAVAGCAAAGPTANLRPAPKLQPASGETYLALGGRLLSANEPALAMRAFNTSLTVEGMTPEALTGAGISAHRQGLLGVARDYLAHARKLAPDSAIAHNNLGMVLLALRDYHGARTAFRSAMALSENGGDEALRDNLRRAELAIAAQDAGARQDPAATQRVVRLGSDMFRIADIADEEPRSAEGAWLAAGPIGPPASESAEAGAPVAETGTGGDQAGFAAMSGTPTGPQSSAAPEDAEAESRVASDVVAAAAADEEAAVRAAAGTDLLIGGEAGQGAE